MATEFKNGEKIPLVDGNSISVIQKLGEGGQGVVYKVSLNGKVYALKWYKPNKRVKWSEFRENLEKNIVRGSPSDQFLWPLHLTKEKFPFGYVMELFPKDFVDFSDILLNRVKLSEETTLLAALNIANAFMALHRKGFSYQDINDGNFRINANTGDVLICDNDNVCPDGKSISGIAGKPGYMAPEVVCGKEKPNSLTDAHSLAVILFKLFCRHDPLMGKNYVDAPCITEKKEHEIYGTKPIFIFDPNDTSNKPVSGIHPNPIKLLPMYPKFFQDAFIESFVKGMKDPNTRLTEYKWRKILINLRSQFFKCPSCDKLSLPQSNGDKIACRRCGKAYNTPLRLSIKNTNYNIPLFLGAKLFECHTSESDDVNNYKKVTGEVVANKSNPTIWGIKNLSGHTWSFKVPEKEPKTVPDGGGLPIAKEVEVEFNGVSGKIA